MKKNMMQIFAERQHLRNAKEVIYENVYFPNGFSNFLEAVAIEQLVKVEPSCVLNGYGYTWINELAEGGIKITTSNHPYVKNKQPCEVTISGPRDALEIVQSIMERHNVEYNGVTKPEHIEVKVEYHDTLNPKLWTQQDEDYSLHPDVQATLEDMSQAFFDFLDIPTLDVEDITITGSSANFNWTPDSDLDIHLVVDMKKATKSFGKLTEAYFGMAKKVWNDLHDLNVKGIPVEFYVQSTDEVHNSTGVYSLMNEEWVEEPSYEEPDVDNNAVKAKIEEWIKSINEIASSNKADAIEKFMKKLSKLRQAGLDEGGEFSTENIAFKHLRNHGYLDLLSDIKTKTFDRELSVEEEEFDSFLDKDDPWESLGYSKKSSQKPTKSPEKRTRINLNVPFAHRESAKKAGARWDSGIRKWYMMVTNEELKKIPSAWR